MFKQLRILPSIKRKDKDLNYFSLMRKDFLFDDGVNILWGRNGIGKSIFLKALAVNGMFRYQFTDGVIRGIKR